MTNMNLFQELEKLLRMESRYCSEDGVLLKNSIVESALALRPDLIRLLLTHEGLKNNFFQEVDGMLVFDKVRFQKFVMNKRFLPDSYTSFKNKIGLTGDDGDFLAESREVVLSWPYKDCVLEGGQTKEDAKRNEVFWNEILAPDEINRLTEPKVLTGFARYDADGKHEVSEVSEQDNLIIKGNNLLALHSLLKKYRGKMKLIYIDPPFNTENDSFMYNDSFKHSTWLTFMRNRLSVARELLRNDGVIFIHIDQNEEAYVKVLMDELFERDNFVNTIAIRSSTPSGTKTVHKNKTIIKQKDFVLVYRKSETATFNPQYKRKESWDTHFNYFLDRNSATVSPLIDILIEQQLVPKGSSLREFDINNNKHRDFYISNADNICQTQSHKNEELKTISRAQVDKVIFVNKGDLNEVMFYNGRQLTPLSNSLNKVYYNNTITTDFSVLLCDFWDDIDFQNTQNEGGVSFPTAKKPEILLSRIIDMATEEGDLVLDYHLGSGTTAAVAHKMGRRYIGVEQMDYIETVAVERLRKVIGTKKEGTMFGDEHDCDQGGISKAVGWTGGGSFVYCELAKANQNFVDEISAATTKEQLTAIWERMQQSGFLSWKINHSAINDTARNFADLSVDDTRRFLIESLDKNLLYIPLSEIDNSEFEITDTDKSLNDQFYGK